MSSGITIERYFVKIAKGELGMNMLRGEYESMLLLHTVAPANVVKPLAWGICDPEPDHYFYISVYHDLKDEQPNVKTFCALVARFHAQSASLFDRGEIDPKPCNRFGFHVTTPMGKSPQDNDWSASWEDFFSKGLRHILYHETETQGHSRELDSLKDNLLEKVIPRLLRPLETHGRLIRPKLVHGDLQIRNVKTDLPTQQPVLFDAGSFWGHNEYDLGKWRPERFSIGRKYMAEYHRNIPKAEPVEGWVDRDIPYSIRFDLSSAHYATNPEPRQLAIDGIRYLVQKYSCGYQNE